jgi:hypothetical protein
MSRHVPHGAASTHIQRSVELDAGAAMLPWLMGVQAPHCYPAQAAAALLEMGPEFMVILLSAHSSPVPFPPLVVVACA